MLCYIINTLLAEQDICTAFYNLVHHILQHFLFLVKEQLQLVRGCDVDLCIHFGLMDLHLCIEQQYPGIFDTLGHILMYPALVHHHALDKFRFLYTGTCLRFNFDVFPVYTLFTICCLDHRAHCNNCQVRKFFPGVLCTLTSDGSPCNL